MFLRKDGRVFLKVWMIVGRLFKFLGWFNVYVCLGNIYWIGCGFKEEEEEKEEDGGEGEERREKRFWEDMGE